MLWSMVKMVKLVPERTLMAWVLLSFDTKYTPPINQLIHVINTKVIKESLQHKRKEESDYLYMKK